MSNIELQVGQTARVDLVLQIGQISDQVTVTGGAPVVQTEEASVGSVIDSHSVTELPLNGRQFLQLTLLVPGVNPGSPGGRQRTERGTMESAISVNGARENANRYLLDGTLNTDPNFNIFVISPNVDCHPGIQGPDGRLWCAVRLPGGSADQHRDPLGHERFSRDRL